jgi:hypothetical protein
MKRLVSLVAVASICGAGIARELRQGLGAADHIR